MASVALVFRKDKMNSQGKAPLHFRIIKDRKTSYISAKVSLEESEWDFSKNQVKPKHKNSAYLNSYLMNKLCELQDAVFLAQTKNKALTFNQLKEEVFGKPIQDFFSYSDSILQGYLLDGKVSSYDKNQSIIMKLKRYVGDRTIYFQDIDLKFIREYENYLKSIGNKVNTIANDMKFIKKIFNDAYKDDLIEHRDIPFNKYKIKHEKTQKDYLNDEELTKVMNVETTPGTRLDLHKDMFVFATYVGGMRVSDVLKLRWINFDGENIHFSVQKTKDQLSIYVPKRALEILDKYKFENSTPTDFIFPMMTKEVNLDDPRELDVSISRCTAYINKNLRIIAEKAKISKKLSFHVSRHTFATRALTKQIPFEAVSKLMGHSSLRQTQIYAKIINSELRKAMEAFND